MSKQSTYNSVHSTRVIFLVDPELKTAFYDGCAKRGLKAAFLHRKAMETKVSEFAAEDTQTEATG